MTNKKVIIIDPGHGFNEEKQKYERPLMVLDGNEVKIADKTCEEDDRDHANNYYREDHMTLLIAMDTCKTLDELGYEVHCTRSDKMDCTYHLSNTLKNVNSWKLNNWKEWQWVKEAGKQYKPDAFVSIHTNAGGGTGITGLYETENPGKKLAKSITKEIKEVTGLKIRRIDKHRYMILREMANGNAVLVECGFHDNPHDLAILLNSTKRKEISKAIAIGIHKYLNPDII